MVNGSQQVKIVNGSNEILVEIVNGGNNDIIVKTDDNAAILDNENIINEVLLKIQEMAKEPRNNTGVNNITDEISDDDKYVVKLVNEASTGANSNSENDKVEPTEMEEISFHYNENNSVTLASNEILNETSEENIANTLEIVNPKVFQGSDNQLSQLNKGKFEKDNTDVGRQEKINNRSTELQIIKDNDSNESSNITDHFNESTDHEMVNDVDTTLQQMSNDSTHHEGDGDVDTTLQQISNDSTHHDGDNDVDTTLQQISDVENRLTTNTTVDSNEDSVIGTSVNEEGVLGEFFLVRTYEEVLERIKEYSERTSCGFVRQGRSKDFAVIKPPVLSLQGHAVYYTHKKFFNKYMKFDGVPHVTTGYWSLSCQYGKSSNPYKRKEGVKPIKKILASMKLNCPTTIFVKQFVKFPQYKISEETESRKRTAAQKLKRAMHQDDQTGITMEFYYAGRLPDISEHRFHDLKVPLPRRGQEIHSEIVSQIQKLYLENYSSLEIVKEIETYVKNEMYFNKEPPAIDNRHFFPGKKDVRNVIAKVRMMNVVLKDDEAKIQKFIQEREYAGDNIYFEIFDMETKNADEDHTGTETEDDDTEYEIVGRRKKLKRVKKKGQYRVKLKPFLLCYQSTKQQSVFRRYNDSVLYIIKVVSSRPVPYSLYLLAVQTNVDYLIIGAFIVSNYNVCAALQKALSVFKEWNRYWKAKYFMIDYHQEICEAIEFVYTDADYYFNFDSCHDSWMEFINTPSNELINNKEEVIKHLTKMAYALTSESLAEAAEVFEQSDIWKKSIKLRLWVQDKWINVSRRWMASYLPDDLMVMNHISATILQCKQPLIKYLETASFQSGLINLLKKIALDIIEHQYDKYVSRNLELQKECEAFIKNNVIPQCCQGLPLITIPYLLPIAETAVTTNFSISKDLSGNFIVSYEDPLTITLVGESTSKQNEESIKILSQDITNEITTNPVDHIIEAVEQIIEINKSENNIATNQLIETEQIDFDAENYLNHKVNAIASESVHQKQRSSEISDDNSNHAAPLANDAIVSHDNQNDQANKTNKTVQITSKQQLEKKKKEIVSIKSNNYDFGQIEINSSVEEGEFLISFGDIESFPVCTCSHWQTYKLPCIHMFSIFYNLPGWSYEMLSPLYRSNNVFNLDTSAVWLTKKTVSSTGCQTDSEKKPSDEIKILTITPHINGSVKITEKNTEKNTEKKTEKIFTKANLANITRPTVDHCEKMLESLSFLLPLFNSQNLAEHMEKELLDLTVDLKTKLLKSQMKNNNSITENIPPSKKHRNFSTKSIGSKFNPLKSMIPLKRKSTSDLKSNEGKDKSDNQVYIKRPKIPSISNHAVVSPVIAEKLVTKDSSNALIIMDTMLPIPLTFID